MSTSFAVRWRLSSPLATLSLDGYGRVFRQTSLRPRPRKTTSPPASRQRKNRYGYVLDPHTACAVVAAERIGGNSETVVLATAHPAKFPDAIEAVTGTRPALPDRLTHLMSDPERFETLSNSLSAVQDFVLKHCRVTSRAT